MRLGQFVHAHRLLEVWDLSVAETPKRWRTGLTLKQGSGRLGDEHLTWLGHLSEADQPGGPEPPTAVFAVDKTLALGVLKEAKARELDVPRDLAIVGYADSATAALLDPPLTMVSVPTREVGFRAMEILSKLMRGKKPRPRRTILGTELVLRQSCGAH